MAENAKDIARSVLVTAINDTDTSIVIDGTTYDETRFSATGDYSVALRDPITSEVELIRVSGRTSATLTASARGAGTPATTARAWPVGTIVECVLDMESLIATITDNAGGGGGGGASAGTYSALPGSATDGTTYHCTDAPYYAVRVSGAWQFFIAGQGRVYPPALLGSYSWVNQGSSTVDSSRGYLALKLLNAGATTMRGYTRAYSGAKKLRVLIDHWMYPITPLAGHSADVGSGIVISESTTAKQITFYNSNGLGAAGVAFQKWTSPTSFSAQYSSSAPGGESDGVLYGMRYGWWEVEDDATNIIVRWSIDGQVWHAYESRSRTDFIAGGPTIFGVMGYVGSGDMLLNVLSWQEI